MSDDFDMRIVDLEYQDKTYGTSAKGIHTSLTLVESTEVIHNADGRPKPTNRSLKDL